MPSEPAAAYSTAYGVDAPRHSSVADTSYAGNGSSYYAHTHWHSTYDQIQHVTQHHAQHDAAALCEAVVVFQQLAELQLLHEKMSHCLLCMQQPRSAVLLPCKHLAVCNDCCKQFTAGEEGAAACPLCGVQVHDTIDGVRLPT
jgi:hypothetical protein